MQLPLPDDFHAHLRQGDLMPGYVRDLVSQFGRAIIMPNTIPAMARIVLGMMIEIGRAHV